MPLDDATAHDLKNFVSAILSRAKLLEREVPAEEARAWVLRQAVGFRKTAERMLALIEEAEEAPRPPKRPRR